MDYCVVSKDRWEYEDFVHLENLPEGIFHDDIKRFFVGLLIPEGAIKIYGADKAFVAFSSPGTASSAILKNCSKIGSNAVSVSYITSGGLRMKLLENARRSLRFDDNLGGTMNSKSEDFDDEDDDYHLGCARPKKRMRPTPIQDLEDSLCFHISRVELMSKLDFGTTPKSKFFRVQRKAFRRINPTRLPRSRNVWG